jgi:multicomponent Na+:H+ antiporter subunit B
MRLLLPLLLALSLYMMLGSFEGLGGGFGSGLLASAAIVLHMMISGSAKPRQTLALSYVALPASGLLFITLWGSFHLLVNQPFLSARWIGEPIPSIGNLGIPMFMNIGVYMVVVGVITQIAVLLLEEAANIGSQPPADGADQPANNGKASAHNGQTNLSVNRYTNRKNHRP